jgi:hypothetical protein
MKQRAYKQGSTWLYKYEVQIYDAERAEHTGLYRRRGALKKARSHPHEPGVAITVVNVRNGERIYDFNPLRLLTVPVVRQRLYDTLQAQRRG